MNVHVIKTKKEKERKAKRDIDDNDEDGQQEKSILVANSRNTFEPISYFDLLFHFIQCVLYLLKILLLIQIVLR